MYNNVLVPVAFEAGRDAHEALEIAQAIRENGGKITVLHVLEHLPDYAREVLPENHIEDAREIVTKKLEPLSDGIENIEIVVIEGHSARAILDYAQKHTKDCIVITGHRPGMQDLFLGSTASRVVRHAQCAVHVVR
ncbi:MAG: universal stress protein [Rhodobacteraceae bacterium]|nr:universal stress protein [Paracoccaceae bacterium]